MAKYIIQAGVTPCDYWDKNGKIAISVNCTQKELEYLHSINYDGVVKIDSPNDQPKSKK